MNAVTSERVDLTVIAAYPHGQYRADRELASNWGGFVSLRGDSLKARSL